MGYKLRHQGEFEWHHVMNRGARHQAVFHDDVDRQTFMDVLASGPDHSDMRVAAWCLMGNHYHLVVKAAPADLSKGMQRLSSLYTRRFSARHRFDGPLFRSRFHSVDIRNDAQLMQTVRYVHRNPFDVEGVVSLDRYRWSSHRIYSNGLAVPRWMTTATVLAVAGGVRELEEFVLAA